MAEARDVMDRLTTTVLAEKDLKSAAECFANDAVAVTPDRGEIRGREQIIEYIRQFIDAFPDVRYESLQKHESGNVAIDEGYYSGTNTGPLAGPAGESLPATGKEITMRSCEVAIVQSGMITQYRFYFDQMELLGQLGLLPESRM